MAGPFETQIGIGLKDNFSQQYRQLRADILKDDENLQRARERLGIRSRQTINQEIQQTRRDYEQLSRSGIVSAGEQARAYEKATTAISKLRHELGETERTQSRMVSTMQRLKNLGGIAAGITAAGMVLKQPITQQRDYDSDLHTAANFLYRDSNDVNTRLAGVDTIKDKVYKATQYGGGTREEGLQALEVMARSKMERDDAFSALPEVMKVHTATGADAADVASLMTSTYNFGLTGKQGTAALDAATTAAQHGKADVSLLAREAPRGLENARGAGFMGPKGYADVMALYEVGSAIAGSPEEGATNVNDLLTELSSTNLANNASRVKIHGKKIDFKSMATNDAKAGHNSLYTLKHVVDATDNADEKMKHLRNELSGATDPERRANVQGAIDEEHRQNVGLFLHNQQSANGFLAYERNPDQYDAISKEVQDQFNKPEGQRSTDVDHAVMADTANYKNQQLDTQNKKASDAATKSVSDALGDLERKIAELAIEFPKVATAAEGAAIAMSAVAAAGLGKAGYDLLTGRGKGGGLLDILKGKPGAGVEAAEDAAGDLTKKPGWLTNIFKKLGGVAVAGGKRIASAGADVVTDGLLDNPFTLGLTGLIYPNDTVSGSDESSELSRLQNENKKKNRIPRTSTDALNMLQNWPGHDAPAGGNAPVIKLPAQPAPAVTVNVHVDGQQLLSWFQAHTDRNARRYGA